MNARRITSDLRLKIQNDLPGDASDWGVFLKLFIYDRGQVRISVTVT